MCWGHEVGAGAAGCKLAGPAVLLGGMCVHVGAATRRQSSRGLQCRRNTRAASNGPPLPPSCCVQAARFRRGSAASCSRCCTWKLRCGCCCWASQVSVCACCEHSCWAVCQGLWALLLVLRFTRGELHAAGCLGVQRLPSCCTLPADAACAPAPCPLALPAATRFPPPAPYLCSLLHSGGVL